MPNQFEKILEGDHLALLEEWTENEDVTLPEEMAEYVKQLEFARGFFYRGDTPYKITKKLQAHFDLTANQAQSRMQDAHEYFYLNREFKKDAMREWFYEKQIQLAQATFLSAKTPQDYDLASKIYERAYKARALHLPDEKELPFEFYEEKVRIFSLKPQDVGLAEPADRNQLARMIDSFNITEEQKIKLKQDVGEHPREIIENVLHEEEED